jgi:hypothetical protein
MVKDIKELIDEPVAQPQSTRDLIPTTFRGAE